MDHRARRYFKEMNRNEISDTHGGLTGSQRLPALSLSGSWLSCYCSSPCLSVPGSGDRGREADPVPGSKGYLKHLTKQGHARYTNS